MTSILLTKKAEKGTEYSIEFRGIRIDAFVYCIQNT